MWVSFRAKGSPGKSRRRDNRTEPIIKNTPATSMDMSTAHLSSQRQAHPQRDFTPKLSLVLVLSQDVIACVRWGSREENRLTVWEDCCTSDVYRFSKNGILEPNNIIPVERIPLNHPALSDVRCFHFSFSVAARWKSGSLFQLNVIVKTVCF